MDVDACSDSAYQEQAEALLSELTHCDSKSCETKLEEDSSGDEPAGTTSVADAAQHLAADDICVESQAAAGEPADLATIKQIIAVADLRLAPHAQTLQNEMDNLVALLKQSAEIQQSSESV